MYCIVKEMFIESNGEKKMSLISSFYSSWDIVSIAIGSPIWYVETFLYFQLCEEGQFK